MIFISINTATRLISIDTRFSAFNEWRESEHRRDKDGKFASTGGGKADKKEVAKTVKKGKIKKIPRQGIILSKQEYGLLHHSLNEYVSNHKEKIGSIITWEADNYLYIVLIEDYNEYVPLFRKEID